MYSPLDVTWSERTQRPSSLRWHKVRRTMLGLKHYASLFKQWDASIPTALSTFLLGYFGIYVVLGEHQPNFELPIECISKVEHNNLQITKSLLNNSIRISVLYIQRGNFNVANLWTSIISNNINDFCRGSRLYDSMRYRRLDGNWGYS